MRVRFLRIAMHDDAPLEHAARGAVEHAAVVFTTRAMRLCVIDARVMIDVLPPANEIETVQCGLRVRGVQARVNARARQCAAECERMRCNTARALLRSSDR